MISPHASIDSTAIIGIGCHVSAGAVIGPGVQLQADVVVGEGSIILNSTIAEGCRIAAGCVLHGTTGATHDRLILEAGVHVQAGAVLSESVHVAAGARIQAGAVIIRDVPPHAIVAGNPAQIVGYIVSADDAPAAHASGASTQGPSVADTKVSGVTLHRFPKILDLRGNLTVGEFGRTVPFEPKRYFMVFGVPNAEIRGEHAHRECKQFLICAQGHCSVLADDGRERQEFLLDDPSVGLYLPPLTWGVQYKYSPDAVLLVFASHFYDSAEYIRSYPEFRALTLNGAHEA
ncbi:WxcM-like domain-containing protein [Dyella sp. 333MFSha]|uniref:WxcM-like domain-containing protein n=1 Tax=Dyella sp. 333MFSha TaxID=1798240 RepID=UPI00087F393C|nr:WxcM-like domain-containing protein [Dyella sp. 333MFSha]SDG47158.1 transferase hexapeptide (six repeat-containing protein) [Dyella sp. 333MFSha]